MREMAQRQVVISEQLARRIADFEIVGSGGYQSLIGALKKRMRGNALVVDDKFYRRVEHYAYDFGSGGWQTFLREILAEVDQAAAHP